MEQDVAALHTADAELAGQGPHAGVGGLEAVVIGAVRGLGRGDWWVPGPRERAGAALRGAAALRVGDPLAGARPYKVGASSALRALHAAGLALADPSRHVLVHLGVGSLADGSLHEALNIATLRRLNVIFCVAWRSLAGAPVPEQLACPPEALAAAFGVRSFACDGRDAGAVAGAVRDARGVTGPSMVLARL